MRGALLARSNFTRVDRLTRARTETHIPSNAFGVCALVHATRWKKVQITCLYAARDIPSHMITRLYRPCCVQVEADRCFRCVPKGCIVRNKNKTNHTFYAYVCAQRTGAAARVSLRRDRPASLTSPAFHACGSDSPFHARCSMPYRDIAAHKITHTDTHNTTQAHLKWKK